MTISCIVATHGAQEWKNLAHTRAIPSTAGQGFIEVLDIHLPDGTLACSRNHGAALAKGKWLLFLDGDDELAPGFGDAMFEVITDDPNYLYTPAVIYARGNVRPKPKVWPRMDFKIGNWCIIGTLISKAVFMNIGGFREYLLYEDYALWAMAEAQQNVEVVEVPDAAYIAHYNRSSRNRKPPPRERVYWHQAIGHDVWPDHFHEPTADERRDHSLSTPNLRFK